MASATGDNAKQSGPSFHAANTNSSEDTTTKSVASSVVIAPRGSSREAVRGLRASYFASTRRLKPIAALRAATIAATIQSSRQATVDIVQPRGTMQGEERAGQGERQREDAVADADERRISGYAVQGSGFEVHCGSQRMSSCIHAAHQVFFHIDDTCRNPHGEEVRALAGLDSAQIPAKTEGLGAAAGRTLEQLCRRNRRHGPGAPPVPRTYSGRRRWPGCRSRTLRRLPTRRRNREEDRQRPPTGCCADS